MWNQTHRKALDSLSIYEYPNNMTVPTPNMITSTRWRSADALLAIAEDPKASARERRLAAMAVLDLCDKAEAALAAHEAPSASAATAAPRPPEHALAASQTQPLPQSQSQPTSQPATPSVAAVQVVAHQPSSQRTPAPLTPATSRADHTPAQPRAA